MNQKSSFRVIASGFRQLLILAGRDKMLVMAWSAPFLAGFFFRFAIPAADQLLAAWIGEDNLLKPYYCLFDLTLAFLTSTMFCFTAAMVMLEERDDGIASYLMITGLGKRGYLISRMLLPAAIAFLITLILLPVFKLEELTVSQIVLLSLHGTAQGLMTALLILLFSSNKLEGMAAAKLSSLLLTGMFGAYFLPVKLQYFLFLLPSYWIGRALKDDAVGSFVIAYLTAVVWIIVLLKRYLAGGRSGGLKLR